MIYVPVVARWHHSSSTTSTSKPMTAEEANADFFTGMGVFALGLLVVWGMFKWMDWDLNRKAESWEDEL